MYLSSDTFCPIAILDSFVEVEIIENLKYIQITSF